MVRRLAGKKMAIPRRRAFIRYFITREPVGGAAGARFQVLGEVFGGFGGENQSGKKLNITPRNEGEHREFR